MAKKQATASSKKTVGARGDGGMKLIRLELEAPEHQQFRVESAKEGLPMALMARRLVQAWLAERAGGARPGSK